MEEVFCFEKPSLKKSIARERQGNRQSCIGGKMVKSQQLAKMHVHRFEVVFEAQIPLWLFY